MNDSKKKCQYLAYRRFGGLLITSIIGIGLFVSSISAHISGVSLHIDGTFKGNEIQLPFSFIIYIFIIYIFIMFTLNIFYYRVIRDVIGAYKIRFSMMYIMMQKIYGPFNSSITYGKIASGIIGGGLIGATLYGVIGAYFGSVIGTIITLSTTLDEISPPNIPNINCTSHIKLLMSKFMKI